MKIQTTRFGEIDVRDDDIYNFPEGMLGFGAFKKYFTLNNPSGGPFEWLQSLNAPNLAFVVCEDLAQDGALIRQQVGVVIAQLRQQPGRTLDVGEEEGDGAGG